MIATPAAARTVTADGAPRDGDDRGSERQGRALALILLGPLALLALLAIVAVQLYPGTRVRHDASLQIAVADADAPVPALPEPAILPDVSPEDARRSNAAVPILAGRLPAAAPFAFVGSADARAAAATCLAAAVLYEAGDDAVGEQAVAQVVLNRVRHPAFPKSVCGVVFQGSERVTGCQFTFTCDGALARRPSPVAWERARDIAGRALGGAVYAAVGTATHYHADWVVPYWRDSLQKIAVVHTHIFYRWPGRWGQPAALAARASDPERVADARVAALGGIAPDALALADDAAAASGDAPLPPPASLALPGVPVSALKGSIVRLADADGGQYVLQFDPASFPGGWAITAFTICSAQPDCLVMGWTSAAQTPRALPVPATSNRTLAFLYRKSSVLETAQPFWDCRRFPRTDRTHCLPD